MRKRRCAAEGVARVSMAVKEGFKILVVTEEGGKDFFAAYGRCQRQVAAGDSLGETDDVGPYLSVVACKHLSGAAKPRRYLIQNQENSMAPADFIESLQISHRLRPHPRGSLHQRLHEQTGKLISILAYLSA